MATPITPNANVLAAQARRQASAGVQDAVRIEWFIKEVSDKVKMTMKQRVKLATELVKNKVVKNISVPVVKSKGASGRIVVTERSKPGEYPRADTTQLMKTIFTDFKESPSGFDGFVGSPLEYSVYLELLMDRRHLSRTLYEEMDKVKRILTGPIK